MWLSLGGLLGWGTAGSEAGICLWFLDGSCQSLSRYWSRMPLIVVVENLGTNGPGRSACASQGWHSPGDSDTLKGNHQWVRKLFHQPGDCFCTTNSREFVSKGLYKDIEDTHNELGVCKKKSQKLSSVVHFFAAP